MVEPRQSRSSRLDRWVESRRGPRNVVDLSRPVACFIEEEPAETHEVEAGATILLTSRECPWRCLYCDLWKNTVEHPLAAALIPRQLDWALNQLQSQRDENAPPLRWIKLYNSGSFFDAGAIPIEDYAAIAERVRGFGRVIVECHPALVGPRTIPFRDMIFPKRLEVAMGLETAHPAVLGRLNKGMTLKDFARAARFLAENGMGLRVFIIVQPPFMPNEAEALHWAQRSLDFAFDCGAATAVLIPARGGNGALEELAQAGNFSPPGLATLEAAADYGHQLRRGRVLADLWDLDRLAGCPDCFALRAARLGRMNLSQRSEAAVVCRSCAARP